MGSKISYRAGLSQDVKCSKNPPSIQTATTSDEKTRISSDNLSSNSSKSIEEVSPNGPDAGSVQQPFQYTRRLELTRAVPEHTIRLSSPSLHDLQTTSAMNDLLSLCETGNGATVLQLLGSNEMMKEIINDYHDCHVEDRHMNITPLMLAAACGHPHVVEELLLAPCVLPNQESGDSYGQTALHIAVSLGQLKCIQAFVACQNVDVNARDNLQMTPLHIATYGHFDEAIELLLGRHDIDCGVQDANGNNIFHIGALSNNVNAVKSIIKHTCMVDFSEICRYGDLSPSEDLSDVRKPTMGETLRQLTEALNVDGLDVKSIMLQNITGLKRPASGPSYTPKYLEMCDDAHRCLVLYTRATYYPAVLTQSRTIMTAEEYSPQEDVMAALSWSPRAVLRENGSYIKICSPLSH